MVFLYYVASQVLGRFISILWGVAPPPKKKKLRGFRYYFFLFEIKKKWEWEEGVNRTPLKVKFL